MSKSGPKPKQTCTVCKHRERAGIDLGIARGVSSTALARRYGLHHDAILRHGKNHLPPQLRAQLIAGPDLDIDLNKLKETESQSLLANLVAIRHRLFATLDTAEECGAQYRRAPGYVDRILQGEKPADLPGQASTKYPPGVNIQTPKAFGPTNPPTPPP